MQACGWDLDPVVLSELVYLCGQAMSEEGTEERTIALPPAEPVMTSHPTYAYLLPTVR